MSNGTTEPGAGGYRTRHRTVRSKPGNAPGRWLAAAVVVALGVAGPAAAQQDTAAGGVGAGAWVNISDPVVNALTAAGTKIPWPGQTSGVTCDRVSGQVYMEVSGMGLWKSADHGATFTHIADGQIGGRCEFGYAMNFDPAGARLACFMLDGKGGMTLDGGTTWHSFADVGRNWDYAAVDWSDPQAQAIFALRHESGGEIYLSTDAGRSWKLLGKRPKLSGVGLFDEHTLVCTEGEGILRSTDAGQTWTKVSDLQPTGRVAVPFKGLTYWLGKDGLLTTRDKGATWQQTGTPSGAGWGPLFGQDEQHQVVADTKGFLRTSDGGATWQRIAPLPPIKDFRPGQPGQFLSIAWDPNANILYASCMANPTYKLQLK